MVHFQGPSSDGMHIPEEWRRSLPEASLTIPGLLEWSLPKQDASKFQETLLVSDLFSKQAPGEFGEISNEIPSHSYIQRLGRIVEGAQTQGYNSIKGGFPGTTEGSTYPLWMIDFWRHLSHAISSKKKWSDSILWAKNKSCPQLVHKYINHIPWMKPLTSQLVFIMEDLSTLLSDQWFNDNHMDFFAMYFNKDATGVSPPILITSLSFSRSIQSEYSSSQVRVHIAPIF
jgi:hypothetical protein